MHVFSTEEVGAIAGQVDSNVSFQTADGLGLSASQVFYILNKYVAGTIRKGASDTLILDGTAYGPDSAGAPLTAQVIVPWSQVARTVLDVQDDLAKTGRIPSAIWLGSRQIPPESYLVGIAAGSAEYPAKRRASRDGSVRSRPSRGERLRRRRFPRPLALPPFSQRDFTRRS